MIRLAVSADQPEIYSLICALEETSVSAGMFAWGFRIMHFECITFAAGCRRRRADCGLLHLRMEFQLHHCGTVAEIMELIVSREVRSKGIGAALLKAAREQAIQHHCIQFEVTSNQKRKQAHRFYQREGLEQTHIKMTEALL